MAKCAICDKKPTVGKQLSITRSHVSKRSPRTWKPNLRTVKANFIIKLFFLFSLLF